MDFNKKGRIETSDLLGSKIGNNGLHLLVLDCCFCCGLGGHDLLYGRFLGEAVEDLRGSLFQRFFRTAFA